MALTENQKKALEIAMPQVREGESDGEGVAKAIDSASAPAAAVADIAVPGSADAEDCANKINELLASLRAAGKLAN